MTNFPPHHKTPEIPLLSLIPLYFMIVGLFLQPITEILPGLWTLIKEPDFLITDYFLVGGIGTSFINAGLLTAFMYLDHLFPLIWRWTDIRSHPAA